MLLNLSNHPFSNWPENQKEIALRIYGHVEDLGFPLIHPEWTHDQVEQLAEQWLSKIKLLPPATVHLMGELTFCFILADKCRQAGIACVASTTERIVEMKGEQKVSVFQFRQFRPYY